MTKPHILIVDDEESIIDTIQYALEAEGCVTTSVTSAEDAQVALQGGGFDLIVLDVGLPGISGIELLKLIRKDSDIPVVFLTARSGDIDRVLGLELGGDDYMVKPFSPRELAARVKAVLRRSAITKKANAAEQSATGDVFAPVWRNDEERRRVYCYGTPLELSRYEYNLLVVLLRKPGVVFSREQLMQLAWEEPESSMDRTVDTHIKTLRAKIRSAREGFDPIITHRGVGYSLKETT